jgi:GNAT superfamily N-acetyltransferase
LADASLLEILGKRGYRISHFENTLARTLAPDAAFPQPETILRARLASTPDRDAWSRAVSMGFSEGIEPAAESQEVLGLFFDSPSGSAWLAEDPAGQVIAGAGMGIHDGAAMLFGDATLPGARGQGAQSALIRARLLYALLRGCDLALACTLPGSISQRNYERFGFRVAYTKALMIREWSA